MNGKNNPNVPNHQPETPLTQDFPAMFDDIRVYCQKIPCYNIISLMILKQTSSINNSHYDPIVVIGSTSLWFYLLMDECNPIISSINDHYIPNIPIQTKTIVYSPNAEFFSSQPLLVITVPINHYEPLITIWNTVLLTRDHCHVWQNRWTARGLATRGAPASKMGCPCGSKPRSDRFPLPELLSQWGKHGKF